MVLMGYDPVITGHVESIGRGIGDSNDETGGLGLPDVEPTFSWVRLAQRAGAYSYRQVAGGVELVAGLSASVAVGQKSGDSQP
jgi:multidrug resistance efflux pump